MSKRTMKWSAAAIAISAVLLGGGILRGAVAQRSTGQHSPKSTARAESPQGEHGEEQGESQEKDEHPTYTSSIQVSQDQPGQSEQAEAEALRGKATITAAQAKSSAVARFAGATVNSVKLENENGSLVYSVLLTDKGGKAQDVKVDAGNARVLHVEAGGPEGHESGEAAEGTEGSED